MGYHKIKIDRGQLGEVSKIMEEVLELCDADQQQCKILQICEVCDIIGAIKLYLEKHHSGISLEDCMHMSTLTEQAFKEGKRS